MLVLEDLVCRYGSIQALHGVSMTIEAGEFVCLIGANGAGKSTLLRAISGLIRPTQGSIHLDGKRIDGCTPAAIVKLGIAHCPEERKVWPHLTVEDHLEIGAYIRRDREITVDIKRIYDVFPRLGERRKQLAGTLSGGEQQMVAIGRALMSRPRFLLMDEPSLGLAPIIIEDVAKTISEIHAGGTTVLLVEQNAFLALKLADRAFVLETGRIVQQGDSKTLMADSYLKDAYLGGTGRPGRGTSPQ